MIVEDGKFYFIKDEFFDVFKDYGLMLNKENNRTNSNSYSSISNNEQNIDNIMAKK